MIRPEKTLLTAAWVAPMEDDATVLRDAGVVYEGGRIVAVGDAKSLRREHDDATVEALGDVVLLPGLVNAHGHLELTSVARPSEPVSFTAWVLKLIEQVQRRTADERDAGVRAGLAACRSFGVTTVGDITARPDEVRSVILPERDRPGVVSFGEVRAMAARRVRLLEQLESATKHEMSPWIRLGVSPHAPYSVEPQGYRACLAAARAGGFPLTTHLAETPHEAEFLASHAGPLRELWHALGGWDDAVPRFEGGPIRYAKHLGLLDYAAASLTHVNYCDDEELAILAAGKASVIYCPRTHRYFAHAPPHRWRDMLAAGINVAVGTDSCASSPDLNLVDDLRLLHEIAPDVPAGTIWSMATRRAAAALGLERTIGTLAPGKHADFVAFAAKGESSLMSILEERANPTGVWMVGRRVVGSSHSGPEL